MKSLAALFFGSLTYGTTSAQFYCEPTFDNGCADWANISISAGSINWGEDGDCTYPDHTDLSTTVNAGEEIAMTVVNGSWCGCAVWVDLDNDSEFAEDENLYYSYVGGTPSYTYDFAITIPEGTPAGEHRMRVIAPWGSDGFLSTNTNGFGPCGEYAYGNFDDFKITVAGGGIGMNELGYYAAALLASPNPTSGAVTLTTDGAAPIERIVIRSTDGRSVQQEAFAARTTTAQIDLSALPTGIYLVQSFSDAGMRMVQVARY